jgi:hypothetical protein
MWSSKDLSYIIFLSVVGLVSTAIIVQMATLISGIHGANYIFTGILAIQTSLSLLLFEGRRWRFFAQTSLFTLLIIPTYLSGPPFFVQGKIHFFVTGLLVDILLNSYYGVSKKREKLKWWSISGALLFWVMTPFFSLLLRPLFYPAEVVALFAEVVLLLLPVIVVESVVGGYMGYRIWLRVKRDSLK